MGNEHEFGLQYFSTWIGDEKNPRQDAEHDLIMELMPPKPGEKILDVGCGKGRLGFFLLRQQPQIKMVFSDISPESRKYLQGQEFVQCSMAGMPFSDNTFDKIFCMHVLAHFPEGAQGLKEAHRVLKKGGKLMILTPNKYYVYLSWLMTAIRKTQSGKRFKYDRTARWLYSKRKLRSQLEACPWAKIEYSYFEGPPRLLPFEWMRAKLIAIATK